MFVPGQRQKAIDFIASRNYAPDAKTSEIQKELKSQTGIEYSDSNIKLIRDDMRSGKAKPTTPNPYKGTPTMKDKDDKAKTPTSEPTNPGMAPAAATSGADPALETMFKNIKCVRDAALAVGGMDNLLSLATQMKAHGIV